MKKNIINLCIFLAMSSGCIAAMAEEERPYTIDVTPENNITIQASGIPPLVKNGREKLSESLTGTESSDCTDYGRTSASSATASIESTIRPDGVTALLTSNSFSRGGSYRKCTACISGNCVGILGHYTTGSSEAKSSAKIGIHFNSKYPETKYLIDISTTSATQNLKLKLQDNKDPESKNLESKTVALTGTPGTTSFIYIELPTSTKNEGECCDSIETTSARVDMTIRKAPILSSNYKLEPYIIGGKQSNAYKYVGAILLDNSLHCTGTIIGKRTILTAAHCVSGYEAQIKHMTFKLGSNLFDSNFETTDISAFDFPRDSASGYFFNPITLEDDIALLYTSTDLPVAAVKMHNGVPSWTNIVQDGTVLTFVGFGYDVVDNEKVGQGIKREASWPINAVENRRVSFKVKGKNTCKGDSGGPAFLIESNEIVQVAVTSGGDITCESGFETRIDAYKAWLATRVH